MSDPATLEDYQRRCLDNMKFEGLGHYVTARAPCPFCGAADFAVYPVVDTERAIQLENSCSDCGRSAKAIATRDRGGVSFEFVQTGGADPPAYLPKMRRVDREPT